MVVIKTFKDKEEKLVYTHCQDSDKLMEMIYIIIYTLLMRRQLG